MDNMDFKNKEGYIRGYRRKGGIIIDDYNIDIDIESINAFLENFCIKTNMSKIDCLDRKPLKTIANRMKELRNLSEEEWKELYGTKPNKKESNVLIK